MDEALLREKVDELMSEVRPMPLVARAAAPAATAMRREMAAIEDSLDHVRVAIKYLVFDLEATKRENRLLREMLGDVQQ